MITGVHHVGQIVEDFDSALTLTEDAESRDDAGSGDGTDPAVRMVFTEIPDCQFHLIAREKRGTDIDPLLDSLVAVSPYHVAYTVQNIREAIAGVEAAGFAMYDSEPTSGLGPYERAFADPETVPRNPFRVRRANRLNPRPYHSGQLPTPLL
ncbi:hypothetical protein BRC86_10500 [Halobacteriales archaeon QS_3_64_16]|nr:MAG: hypothetical protein BRC86_10500 [Halobacteriales archaeon QS_3_64_16]